MADMHRLFLSTTTANYSTNPIPCCILVRWLRRSLTMISFRLLYLLLQTPLFCQPHIVDLALLQLLHTDYSFSQLQQLILHHAPPSVQNEIHIPSDACLAHMIPLHSVPHGYGNTRGVSKTGSAGTGTVVDFDTPQHTAYPYRGIAGMYGYITVE
jgi:hypothetical protein